MDELDNGRAKVTCIEVARLAGVGHSTVSRVINNPGSVHPRTRKKVLEAIRITGYKPSSAARMLVRKKSETIGLIFEKEHVQTYYGSRLIEGLSEVLTDKGMKLAMSTVRWHAPVSEIEGLPLLKTVSIDGLILDIAQIRGDLDLLVARLGLPHVFINPPSYRAFNTIMPDDPAAARLATQRLIDRGHRKIGFISAPGSTKHSSMADRMKGYAETMIKADLKPLPSWDVPLESVDNPVRDYLDRTKLFREEHGCTAIVAYNAIEAARVIYACYQLGLKVPEDIHLVACDYDPVALVPPARITCFHFDRTRMAKMAVAMLEERIGTGKDVASISVSPTLVDGETG